MPAAQFNNICKFAAAANGVCVCVCVWVWVVGVGDNNRNNENNNKSQPTFVYGTQFDILPYYTTLALALLRSPTLSPCYSLSVFALCTSLRPLSFALTELRLSLSLAHLLRLQFFVNFRFTSHT